MGRISLRLPESTHEKVKEFAREKGISINQFIAGAVTENFSAYATGDYFP